MPEPVGCGAVSVYRDGNRGTCCGEASPSYVGVRGLGPREGIAGHSEAALAASSEPSPSYVGVRGLGPREGIAGHTEAALAASSEPPPPYVGLPAPPPRTPTAPPPKHS